MCTNRESQLPTIHQPSTPGVEAQTWKVQRRAAAEVVEEEVEATRRLLAGPARSAHSLHAAQPSLPLSLPLHPSHPPHSRTHVTARFVHTDTTTTEEYRTYH